MTDTTDLIGLRVPGGTYQLAGYKNRILRDTVYAEESAHVHPIAAFIAAQQGMGVTVDEFFTLLQSSIDDGPVLAETTIELIDDMATDRRYDVDGGVENVVRKQGAAFGAFDLVTCAFRLLDGDDVVARVTNVYAIRRKESR